MRGRWADWTVPALVLVLVIAAGAIAYYGGLNKSAIGESGPVAQQPLASNFFGNITIFTDPDTGCEYLLYRDFHKGGITPRLRPDGRPSCPCSSCPLFQKGVR